MRCQTKQKTSDMSDIKHKTSEMPDRIHKTSEMPGRTHKTSEMPDRIPVRYQRGNSRPATDVRKQKISKMQFFNQQFHCILIVTPMIRTNPIRSRLQYITLVIIIVLRHGNYFGENNFCPAAESTTHFTCEHNRITRTHLWIWIYCPLSLTSRHGLYAFICNIFVWFLNDLVNN